ncbi:MAG: hypothetical protein M3Y35_05170 [Actinomycetota bacterium]|nr:hypothetical protein [Actinomycetota bacterium]
MSDLKVFDLTPLTRSGNQRRSVIFGIDVYTKYLIIGGVALIAALPITAILWTIFGTGALLVLPVIVGGALWSIEHRSANGLRLPVYKTLDNRRKATTEIFTVCGQQIEPDLNRPVTVKANTVPVVRPDEDPFAPLKTEEGAGRLPEQQQAAQQRRKPARARRRPSTKDSVAALELMTEQDPLE